MKYIFLLMSAACIYCRCSNHSNSNQPIIKDGFYEVINLVQDTATPTALRHNEVLLSFDTLFNPGDFTKVIVDTAEYVPLELESDPTTEAQTENKKLLSVSFTPNSAAIIKEFTAKRMMKEVVIVLDGKAVTMHKIRDTITGQKMQITRCGDNACEYLFVKMKKNVKK